MNPLRPGNGPFDPGPMDPARFQELVDIKERQAAPAPAPVVPDPIRLPVRSSDLALELLEEAKERRLGGGEILVLFEEAALHDVGRIAHQLRLERAPADTVTYIIDRNVTYTNLCYADCKFCAFNRHQGDDDAYLLDLDTILDKCRTVVDAGRGVECKNRNYFNHGEWGEPGTDEVPLEVTAQVHWSMRVTGLPRWDVAVLLGGNRLGIYHLEYDEELAQQLWLKLAEAFELQDTLLGRVMEQAERRGGGGGWHRV